MPFPGLALPPGVLLPPNRPWPDGDAAAHACQLAPALEQQIQALMQRVSKLERSRGQMTKDIQDMLSDTRELQARVGVEPATSSKKGLALRAFEAPTSFVHEEDTEPPEELMRRKGRTRTLPATLPRVPEDQPLPVLAKFSSSDKMAVPPGLCLPLSESLRLSIKDQVSRIEWRIDNFKQKLKDSMGRPLVSPPFEAAGLDELRLMVFPNLGLAAAHLTTREQKSWYEAKITEGPFSGALKLKVVTGASALVMKFTGFVGTKEEGPLEHNFADHIICGVEFSHNWLSMLSSGSITVGIEILEVNGQGSASAAAAKLAEAQRPASQDIDVVKASDADVCDWEQMNREIHECLEKSGFQ